MGRFVTPFLSSVLLISCIPFYFIISTLLQNLVLLYNILLFLVLNKFLFSLDTVHIWIVIHMVHKSPVAIFITEDYCYNCILINWKNLIFSYFGLFEVGALMLVRGYWSKELDLSSPSLGWTWTPPVSQVLYEPLKV